MQSTIWWNRNQLFIDLTCSLGFSRSHWDQKSFGSQWYSLLHADECQQHETLSDISMHLYHSSHDVLYLGCEKLLFWIHVNFLLLSCPMKNLRCPHAFL
ncbi:hypothetical protein LAZ67_8003410 [Cordylochernes scorpioides]|uniref:Uncharacterized protein n=1 Tax=Cordylochernes scorpioides TaxID=51811 RepID=A0ABY6KS26_9ARAC|nr:hypothetical protein LAZ67_8003410 [Cordylochernes scorpioides]